MKSKLFFLLPALTALSACSNDEALQPESAPPVAFKTYISPQSRGIAATEDASANLQQNFGVFAYRNANGIAGTSDTPNSLYNEKVTYTPGVGFTYTNHIYWPASEKLGFYAYSPYYTDYSPSGISNFVPASNTEVGVPGFTFSVNPDVNNQLDLLVAKAEGLSGGTVALPFIHALSRVELEARTSATNYRVAIMGVRFRKINSTGNYSFGNSATSWSNQSTPVEYTAALSFNGTSTPTGGTDAVVVLYNNNSASYTKVTNPDNSLYLLPQSLDADAEMVITFNVYNVQNGGLISQTSSQEKAINIGNVNSTILGLTKWEKSRRIIYRLNFMPSTSGPGSLIEFNAVVSDWSIDYGDLS